ncbi:MAG: hypothetical protein DRP45_00635 [Candidatus Zixiibacteriota bacterium]|nr:MAG: hypothetical protein DRP45_00635 [candidate division Zixibacteria bacterium]
MTEYLLIFAALFVLAFGFYLGYERFLVKGRKAESSLYVDALRDLLDGKQEAAFSKLRQVVAADSGNLDAYLRLGQILRDNNQAARALQVHKDLTLRPGLTRSDRVAILHQIAADSLAAGDMKMSGEALGELISLAPGDYWAQTRLMELQKKNQKWDEVFETAAQLLKLEGNKSKKTLAQYKFQAGEQMYRKREYHKARVLYKEAISLDPAFVSAYLAIGDSYCEEDRHEDAVTFWNKLIAAVPEKGHRVIDRLKKTLFDLGRFGDIQNICESILEHDPRNLKARCALAEFYEKKGDVDRAVELWEQAMDDHSRDSQAALDLIRVHLDKGNTDKIRRLLKVLEQRRNEQKDEDSKPSSTSPAVTTQV